MKTAHLVKPQLWRYTVEEYDRLVRHNMFRDARVELIEGKVIAMPPQMEPHAVGVILAGEVMRRAFGEGFTVRQQMPLQLGNRSKPEPDVAVVTGGPRASLKSGAPAAAALIIEISDATLRHDRGKKALLYARSGFADYWIVNLVDRQLEVHRDPIADPATKRGFRYNSIQVLKPGEAIAPLAAPGASVAVNDLLP